MLTKKDAIIIISNFISDCKKINIIFSKVVLFGSLANDKASEGSDIDLALVSYQFTVDRFENALLIAPVTIKYLDIDAQTFPVDYFNNGDPFIHEILRTDIEIN
jgi:predicted nucleotidyltransferase